MTRYVVLAAITLCAAPVRAQSSVPLPIVDQQQAVERATTTQGGPNVVASEEAKQVNPQARQPRRGRKFWISVTPLIVAVAVIVAVAIVVPK